MSDLDPKVCAGGQCPQVADAADRAVKKVFAILGVDVDVPKEVEEFRDNLRFGASMRRAADKGTVTVFVLFITATFAAIWVSVASHIMGKQ